MTTLLMSPLCGLNPDDRIDGVRKLTGIRRMWKSLSHVWLFVTHGLYSPWSCPCQDTGVGSLSFLQEIFLTQGLNAALLHCRRILYQLSHQRSPRTLEWVAYLFSRGSSWPRNWTGVSCIAGGFFVDWAIREALSTDWVLLFPWLHLPLLKSLFGECSWGRQISPSLLLIHRGLLRYLSPDFLVTSAPVMFLPSPWPSSHTIAYSSWTGI